MNGGVDGRFVHVTQGGHGMGKKVADSRRRGKELRLLEDELVFVGVDVHKKTYDVALWSDARGLLKSWRQPANGAVLCTRLEPLGKQVAMVTYEAGPTGYGLFDILCEAAFPAQVVAPSRTPASRAPSAKSDRLDANQLAFYSGKGVLKPIHVPSLQERLDRSVERRRDQVATQCKRVRTQIKSFLLMWGIPEPKGLKDWTRASVAALRDLALCEELRGDLDSYLRELDFHEGELKKADGRLAELAKAERYAARDEGIQRVPGVGLITSMTFLTEVVRPERFETGNEVAAYVGLAPWTSRSGGTAKSGRIMKAGNRRVRRVLVQAAWHWVRCDPGARAVFGRIAARRKNTKIAIIAMARRLVILLWRIATTGLVYRSPGPDDAGGEPAPGDA
jgi:transposase